MTHLRRRLAAALEPGSAGAFVTAVVARLEVAHAGLAVELPDRSDPPAADCVVAHGALFGRMISTGMA